MAPNNWQLDQLIGHVHEQRWLEHVLREDLPARRGQTVVITGALGSGRAALARFALWNSLHSLNRSIELDAINGTIHFPPEKKELQQETNALKEIAKGFVSTLKPFGSLLFTLASLCWNVEVGTRCQRLQDAIGGVTRF